MSLWDILKNKRLPPLKPANAQTWYTPYFITSQSYNVFESDVVQQAIRCILQEVKKLEPRHVIRNKNKYNLCYDSVQFTLENPNELMTTSDFLEKVVYNLLTTNNSFVLPVWENGSLEALYPLHPADVKFVQDVSGTMFIDLIFANNYETRLRYSDIIHIRYNFGQSEFMGGNVEGKPDLKAIQKGVNLNESLLNGVQKSIESSYAINGVLKYGSVVNREATEQAAKELTERLRNNESGLMALDSAGEFIPFKRDVKIIDESTLKFTDEKILRNYGVSIPILTGNYTTEQYAAFYQKVLEPIIISLNQSFTKALFTKEGRTVLGNKIIFYTSELNFMSMTEKKEIGELLSSTGAICVDELRNTFGFAPCEDEELGKAMIMSKNFGDAKSVKDQVTIEADAIKSFEN